MFNIYLLKLTYYKLTFVMIYKVNLLYISILIAQVSSTTLVFFNIFDAVFDIIIIN